MINYQQSSIWQRTLAHQLEPDDYSEEREFLRVAFESFREKAKTLAGEIARVLPEYTVHDINHIDALWDTAELIVPKDFDINPAEAFVLGGAFLLHDLGMALAAYPKGVNELREEQIWMDTVASLKKDYYIKNGNNNGIDINAIERKATEKTLRLLHAKRAGELANVSWKNPSDQDVFLMDNVELRCSLGNVIGLIAYSHWLKTDELESNFPHPLGALSRFPSHWTVDALKLACIIRLADAMQIDDRRAPSFLRLLRSLSPSADVHWNFQEKLYQPRIETNRVVYTSKSSFTIDEVDSWWTCFDTLKMIDSELEQVDAILSQKYKRTFNAIGVSSIEDTKKLSKLITVEGWEPVDVKIRVDNVAKLVSSIGGSQLYGDNSIVPLRELIQNASDAIRARRLFENEEDSYGDIYIHIGEDKNGTYIEIEDNGIGMSMKVLTGPFLDFGQSFWGTDLMHEEFPGLESKGYKSTGKYGIGFFSLFMWGNRVQIFTNRFDTGRDCTLSLEFNDGASSRPILRKAKPEEYIRNGGTRIRVWLKENIIDNILFSSSLSERKKHTLSEIIEELCPSIDCNVLVMVKNEYKIVIKANDWITISADKFLKKVIGKASHKELKSKYPNIYDILIKNMSIIRNQDKEIVGRSAMFRMPYDHKDHIRLHGIVTVGGFKTSGLSGFIGIFVGESARASRDIGLPIIQNIDLFSWTAGQTAKLEKQELDNITQIEIAEICRAASGKTGNLKIAEHKNGFMNYDEIKIYVSEHELDNYILVQDAAIQNYERDNSVKILCNDNVFWMPVGIPGILQTYKSHLHDIEWPERRPITHDWFHDCTLKGMVIEAISEGWNCRVDDIYKASDFSDDDTDFSEYIGAVDGKEFLMDNVDIIKKSK